MKLAKRLENLPPYLFVAISKKIAERKAKGEEVISFAVGDPDMPTPSHIVSRLCQAAQDPANHHYPESDSLPELRQAVASKARARRPASVVGPQGPAPVAVPVPNGK